MKYKESGPRRRIKEVPTYPQVITMAQASALVSSDGVTLGLDHPTRAMIVALLMRHYKTGLHRSVIYGALQAAYPYERGFESSTLKHHIVTLEKHGVITPCEEDTYQLNARRLSSIGIKIFSVLDALPKPDGFAL